MSGEVLLRVEKLAVYFPVTEGVFGRETGSVKAVDGISFDIRRGGTLGLVGESGCGKSTVGRAILRLLDPTAGRVCFDGRDITKLAQSKLRELRREMQIIFQDPFASLNPRMTVMDIVGEALEVHGISSGSALESRVIGLLDRVGIPRAWVNRYPHEFSGGQRQRISIARAIALEPKLIICDEAVSALDVSIQAQVINLLIELRREMNLAYLFISHDLAVVRHISDEVAVMYLGQIVERAPTARLFQNPVHPYTKALLSAIPVADPEQRTRRIPLEGDVPSPLNPPSGCYFHTRCPVVMDRCRTERPPEVVVAAGHQVSCFLAEAGMGEATPIVLSSEPAPAAAPSVQERSPRPLLAHAPSSVAAESQARIWNAGLRYALLGLGGVALLLGAQFLGLLIAGVGVVQLAARGEQRARLAAVAGTLGVALCLFGGLALEARGRVDAAERQLTELVAALDAVAQETGRYPQSLRELGWRLPPIVGDARPLDPWGRPWQYRLHEDGGFALGSLGPDGVSDSGDELKGSTGRVAESG